jgi:thiol-disulfide isomerase/thioredoxin
MEHEKRMLEFLKSTAGKKPGSFLSLLVKALIPVEVPEFKIPDNGLNADSLRWIAGYSYNRDHFFDNIDLSDSRLVRTPILHNRLSTYFSKVLIQHPDSLSRMIPIIVDKTEGDSVMFRYLVVFLFNHFRESPIMGHDGITVKIIDDYYLSGRANWINQETFESLSEDANRLRTNLIGKKAVDLVMETYSGQHKSIYDIKKDFTIVYFWEPNCGHCKTSTPKLKELYNKYKAKDIEVFAVCTQDNREEWEAYIAEHQLDWINAWDPDRSTHFDFFYNVNATPLIYILNKEKIIIAKKIGVENIEGFLNDYRKQSH